MMGCRHDGSDSYADSKTRNLFIGHWADGFSFQHNPVVSGRQGNMADDERVSTGHGGGWQIVTKEPVESRRLFFAYELCKGFHQRRGADSVPPIFPRTNTCNTYSSTHNCISYVSDSLFVLSCMHIRMSACVACTVEYAIPIETPFSMAVCFGFMAQRLFSDAMGSSP